jgi:thioredoxin reductase (NADPH)
VTAQKPIVVYGADWCADCHASRRLLDEQNVAYEYKDIDSNTELKQEMLNLVGGNNVIPTVVVSDTILQEPSNAALLVALQADNRLPTTTQEQVMADTQDTTEEKTTHDVIIVGAGPAALAAAIYTTREDIDTLLFERGVVGGLAAVTDKIDNYPGFPDGIEGLTLADDLRKQAERFGAVIELGEVTAIHDEGQRKRLETTNGDMYARSVLIATGSDYKKIGVPGEIEYYGRGVHYCATCDGAFYRDKKLVVVGGGNSAIQETIFLTRYASHIDLLVRSTIKASDVLQQEIQKFVDEGKVTIHLATSTNEIVGENKFVTKVLATKDGEKTEMVTDGVFVFVGLEPNSQFIKESSIRCDEIGFIITDQHMQTTMKGVFAAGDIRSGATMQIASATGEGATAALKLREYLEGHLHPVQN